MLPPDTAYERSLLKRHWPEAEVPAGLAERIVARAVALPQRDALKARIARLFALPEDRWHQALAYQFAALALLAILGLYAVQLNTVDDEDVDVDTLIADMMGDVDEL